MLCKLFSFFFANLALIIKVAFISNKNFANIIVRKSVYFVHPLTNIFKGLSICYVIHNNDSVGSPIVTSSERPEPLLACSIPYLQFDVLAVHLNSFYFEINSDCVEEIFVK